MKYYVKDYSGPEDAYSLKKGDLEDLDFSAELAAENYHHKEKFMSRRVVEPLHISKSTMELYHRRGTRSYSSKMYGRFLEDSRDEVSALEVSHNFLKKVDPNFENTVALFKDPYLREDPE